MKCAPENDVAPEPSVTQFNVNTLLAEVKTAEGWHVQFMELEPGTVAMHASFPDDLNVEEKKNTPFLIKGKSITEIYRALAKDKIDNRQLQALEAANERMQQPALSITEDDYSDLNALKPDGTSARTQSDDCFVPPGEPDYAEDAANWRDYVNHMDDYGYMNNSSANQAYVKFEVNCKQVMFYSKATDYSSGAYFAMHYKHDGRWHQYENTFVNPRQQYIHGLWSNKRRMYRGEMTGIPCARANLGYKIIIF